MKKSAKVDLPYNKIVPSPDNPRKNFDPTELAVLAESIKANGIIQPLLVRVVGDGATYEIIDGERRHRAAALAGIKDIDLIPCLFITVSEHEAKILRLVTDSRVALNPIEQSIAYNELVNLNTSMKQDDLAKLIGKDKSTVSRLLALVRIPIEARELFISCSATTDEETHAPLTPTHAQHLLRLTSGKTQYKDELVELAKKAYTGEWGTRKLQDEVDKILNPQEKVKTEPSAVLQVLNDYVSEELGSNIKFKSKKDGAFSFTGAGSSFTELADVVYKLFGKVLTEDGELLDAVDEDEDEDEDENEGGDDSEDNEGIPAISLTTEECEQLKKACTEVLQNEADITDYNTFRVREDGRVSFVVGYNSREQADMLKQTYQSSENPNFRIFGFYAANVEDFREKLGLASLQEDTQDEGEPVTQTPNNSSETPARTLRSFRVFRVTAGKNVLSETEAVAVMEAVEHKEAIMGERKKYAGDWYAPVTWNGKKYRAIFIDSISRTTAERQEDRIRYREMSATLLERFHSDCVVTDDTGGSLAPAEVSKSITEASNTPECVSVGNMRVSVYDMTNEQIEAMYEAAEASGEDRAGDGWADVRVYEEWLYDEINRRVTDFLNEWYDLNCQFYVSGTEVLLETGTKSLVKLLNGLLPKDRRDAEYFNDTVDYADLIAYLDKKIAAKVQREAKKAGTPTTTVTTTTTTAEPAERQAETHSEQDIDTFFAGLDGSKIDED